MVVPSGNDEPEAWELAMEEATAPILSEIPLPTDGAVQVTTRALLQEK